MTVLDDLPTEVLTEILSYLPSREDGLDSQPCSSKQDFYDLSLCSRRLHAAIETSLYSRIDGSYSISVALITRTLLDRPWLALLVQEASVEVKNDVDMGPTNDELMDSFRVDSLSTAVESTGICSWDRAPCIEDFKSGRSDAREALLLSMYPI